MLGPNHQPSVLHAEPGIGGISGVKGLASEQGKGQSQRRQSRWETQKSAKVKSTKQNLSSLRIPEFFCRDPVCLTLTGPFN